MGYGFVNETIRDGMFTLFNNLSNLSHTSYLEQFFLLKYSAACRSYSVILQYNYALFAITDFPTPTNISLKPAHNPKKYKLPITTKLKTLRRAKLKHAVSLIHHSFKQSTPPGQWSVTLLPIFHFQQFHKLRLFPE